MRQADHDDDAPDAWSLEDPTACLECGRDSCVDHLPPDSVADDGRAVAPVHEPLTEVGAAERFTRVYRVRVRFDHLRRRWLLWEGHHWRPDADAEMTRLAIAVARAWQREGVDLPDLDARGKVTKFALNLERRGVLHNVLALAADLKPIADRGDHWDADPWALGTPSGVVDLRTGICRPGQPADRITMQTAAAYDPLAQCPRWEQFIADLFGDHDGLATFVQRAIGYSLTGETREQVLFLLYGTGANGKGTLANTLKMVLGDYAWNMPFATIEFRDRTAIPNDLAALDHRRFVIASETNDGTRFNEARIKALTGCDPITARFLHSEFFEFEPVAKFWLSVNHRPIVRDDSFGFWRRMRLIPLTKRFPVNAALATQLQAEAAGILAWAIRGCLDWQRDGLNAPPVVIAATADYEADSDPLKDFLDQACDLDEPAAEVNTTDLYKHYDQWRIGRGISDRERLSQTLFGRKMAERFEKLRDRDRGVIYRGIARRVSHP